MGSDPSGLNPGDPFKSPKEAVIDFALTFNGESITNNKEYASRIYTYKNSEGETTYSYTEPVTGTEGYVYDPPKPVGVKSTGIVHTHGAWDKKLKYKEAFSGEKDVNLHLSKMDIYNAKEGHKTPIWGVFPNGKIEMWSPNWKSGTMPEKVKVNVDIPCDANAPNRNGNNNTVNNQEAQKGEKDEEEK